MKKTVILSFLMLIMFTIAGCSDVNSSKSNDFDSNYGNNLKNDGNIDDVSVNQNNNSNSNANGSINDSDSNSEDSDRITGTDVFVEKTFSNVYDLSSFFTKLNVEDDMNFIIPNYSCQNEYDFYYYFKGTCSGESYEKNPDNVEYVNYIFGGVLYSIDEQGEKRTLYYFDVLARNLCYNPEVDTIEYISESTRNNSYLGYLNGIAIIKLHFETKSDNYTEIINETIKSYCIIDRGDNI